MINLKYFQKYKNIGDQFSYLLASHYFGEKNVTAHGNTTLDKPNLLLIGSILEWCDPFSHVCGGGLISSHSKLTHLPAQVHCVRGPLTAHFLRSQGVKTPNVYGDPGILAPALFPNNQPIKYPIGIIPHYADLDAPWINHCKRQDIPIISPLSTPEVFFKHLQQCEIILSSSLHGIIFAHSYQKPALWIELSDKVIGNGFKFYDYYLSIGCSPENTQRHQVSESLKPNSLANLATYYSQHNLIDSLAAAIDKTKQSLR